MKILALDTSLSACSVAFSDTDSGQTIKQLHKIAPRQQAQLILEMLRELLASTGINLQDLDMIAFAAGPGSFTGLRIASSVVQALSFVVNIPVLKVSTLAALAQTVFDDFGIKESLIALDAHAGQIYSGYYAVNDSLIAVAKCPDFICEPSQLSHQINSAILTQNAFIGVGDAWIKHPEVLKEALGQQFPTDTKTSVAPSASAILKLAVANLQTHPESSNFEHALPIYLH